MSESGYKLFAVKLDYEPLWISRSKCTNSKTTL